MAPSWVWIFAPLTFLGMLFQCFYFAAALKAALNQFAARLTEIEKLAREHERRIAADEATCHERHHNGNHHAVAEA